MNTAHINYEEIYLDLYNPSQPGVIVVQGVLGPALVSGIRRELESNTRNYVSRPESYGTTMQGLSSWDFERAVMKNYEHLSKLDEHYTLFSNNLHLHMETCQKVDEVRANSSLYKKGSVGIGAHRDNTFSVNFIAIYVISGSNAFCTAKDKSHRDEIKFAIPPGSLVLMRGPRDPSENDLRPIHYVEEIESDRHIVLYREMNHDILHKTNRNYQYNA